MNHENVTVVHDDPGDDLKIFRLKILGLSDLGGSLRTKRAPALTIYNRKADTDHS